MNPQTPKVPPSIAARSENDSSPVVATGPGTPDDAGREAGGIEYGSYIADLIQPEAIPVFDDFWNKLNESFELYDSRFTLTLPLCRGARGACSLCH